MRPAAARQLAEHRVEVLPLVDEVALAVDDDDRVLPATFPAALRLPAAGGGDAVAVAGRVAARRVQRPVRRPGRRAFGQRQLAAHARARCDPGFRHRRRRTSPRSSRRASGAYRVTASASSRRRGSGPSANRDSSSDRRVGSRPAPPLALPSWRPACSCGAPCSQPAKSATDSKAPARMNPSNTVVCCMSISPLRAFCTRTPAAKQHGAACKARGLLAQSRPRSSKAARAADT